MEPVLGRYECSYWGARRNNPCGGGDATLNWVKERLVIRSRDAQNLVKAGTVGSCHAWLLLVS